MSFTVYHTKNGVQVPIKISILDAFRGVPDPRPRKPKTCSCCGKLHHGTAEANSNKKEETPKPDDKKNEKAKEDDGLTDDDRTIIRMKIEKPTRPWQEIIDATGFTDIGLAKARWKEIEHRSDEPAEKVEADDKQDKKKTKKDRKKNEEEEDKGRKKREEGLKRQAELNAAKAAAEKNDKAAEDNKGKSPAKTENKASACMMLAVPAAKANVNDMKALADKYDQKKWQAMASKHYDKTGIRITAAQAKKMAEGK